MTIQIFNTASRRKEPFEPQRPQQVTMYNCGPTVYDFFHIGNARNFVVVDTIRRHFEFRGYEVKFAQNFTDIDDKIIRRAGEKGQAWDDLARQYTDEYFRCAGAIGVREATVHPRATDHIPQMIGLIEQLIGRGLAYARNGNVYFRVRSFESYGTLSGKDPDQLQEGARVEVGEEKDDPLDFALWKATKPGEPSWQTPWGAGRPGWHIECSAMCMHHFGDTVDIHCGGTDLVFPHHENERAQSTGATGKPFAKYWVHNGFLTINQEKMAKSSGNFFTIDQVLEKFEPAAVRFYLLSAHYRHPLEFSEEALHEAASAVGRFREGLATARQIAAALLKRGIGDEAGDTQNEEWRQSVIAPFGEAMDDDFNTQKAIGGLFDALSALNDARIRLAKGGKDGAALLPEVTARAAAIAEALGVLGITDLLFPAAGSADSALVDQLLELFIETRQQLRAAKNFEAADAIRNRLADLGIQLQDHPSGTIAIRS